MGMVTLDKRLHSLGSQNTLEIKLNPLKFFSIGLRNNSFYSVSVPYQIFPFEATWDPTLNSRGDCRYVSQNSQHYNSSSVHFTSPPFRDRGKHCMQSTESLRKYSFSASFWQLDSSLPSEQNQLCFYEISCYSTSSRPCISPVPAAPSQCWHPGPHVGSDLQAGFCPSCRRSPASPFAGSDSRVFNESHTGRRGTDTVMKDKAFSLRASVRCGGRHSPAYVK